VIQKSTSLKYEPSPEPLHIFVKELFLDWCVACVPGRRPDRVGFALGSVWLSQGAPEDSDRMGLRGWIRFNLVQESGFTASS